MCRTPKAGNTGGDAGKGVRPRRRRQTHGRGRRVLFVIRMQDEDAVHRPAQDRIGDVLLGRDGKAHVQEVRRVIEIVARIHEGLADRILVGHGRDRRHLRDQPVRGDLALARVVDVGRIVIEGRHRADHAHHRRHRMRIPPEAPEEVVHLFVDHRVAGDCLLEILELARRRQFPVKQQVADFEEMRLRRQFVDGIAAVEQFALVAVDEGDRAVAGCGRGESGVIGEHPRLRIELADIHHIRARGG